MNDQKEINVTFKHYIPEDWIEEFENSAQEKEIAFKKSRDDEEYLYATGPELADIIVFIRDNPESIFLAPALYDIVKSSLIALWKKLRKIDLKNIKSYKTSNSTMKRLSVQYEDSKNRRVTITIEEEHNNETIEEAIEEALSIIKTDKKEKFFKNEDFVDKSHGFDAIELKYNSKSKAWEPVNFGDIRRKMEEYQRWAEENFNN